MTYYKAFLSFIIIFSLFLLNDVPAFSVEGIIGGYPAPDDKFKYQVAILGRKNHSNIYCLLCGGGIINDQFILSAAQCFLNLTGQLRELSFSISAGSIDLKATSGILIEVDVIYLSNNIGGWIWNDIALAKLKVSLNLQHNPKLSKLDLPYDGENFYGKQGIVAGHGFTWVKTAIKPETRKEVRVDGGTDFLLKYAYVAVTDENSCKSAYPDIQVNTQLCGIMLINNLGEYWGVCARDSGSPLVIDNKIVGVVSRNPPKCNDTISGCIYTKVSAYMFFIENLLEGGFVSYIEYYNRQHIPFQYSRNITS